MDSNFKLFVSNVPYNCTEDEFKNYMLTLDGITSVRLVQRQTLVQKQTEETNKGFGFITVATQEIHDNFLKNDQIVFNGRKLKFIEYVNQQKFYKLHVTNVPENVSEQNLFDLFSKFGTVDSVKKDFNFTSKEFKGTALVVYTNYEDFNKVLTMQNIQYVDNITFTVTKRRMPFRRQFRRFPKRPIRIERPEQPAQ